MKNQPFSRRKFLSFGALGGLGAAGALSRQFTPAALVAVAEDALREVAPAPFVPRPATWDENSVTMAWLGHSSVLINFYGLNILTDPVLFRRIGVETRVGTLGPKRLVEAALKVADLPRIDLVVLSHAHLDHLDRRTLRALPGAPQAVTARGTADLLKGTAIRSVCTVGWGERAELKFGSETLEVRAFEVAHWGARWRYDKHRGYNGYVLSREGRRVIFGGDTAWTTGFEPLTPEGPYDCAIMPIGAYNPWLEAHCTPEQAVTMAEAAGANHFLPVHFGTFRFGREGTSEPLERLEAVLEPERVGWRSIGETFRML